MGFSRVPSWFRLASLVPLALGACGGSGGRSVVGHVGHVGQGGTGGAGEGGSSSAGNTSLAVSAKLSSGPPAADAGGLCGNQILPLALDPPTVYFVLDISGSMSTPENGGTRLQLVQGAVVEQAARLNYLVKMGAAAFPLDVTATDTCHIGAQIVAPALQDLETFETAINALVPNGGTPTAATLNALAPNLEALAGKTIVVLATDGGPNCNPAAACGIQDCIVNIEDCSPPTLECCVQDTNCCEPTIADPRAGEDCLDETATVNAVAAIYSAGIPVYVVGIPGSQFYADALNAMALAGGAPQFAAPFYYQVSDLSTLGDVLTTIASAVIPCSFTLTSAPPNPTETNVYFDTEVVMSDPTNGWSWTSSVEVTLNGSACAKLKSGAVSQVQVVSGCPTEGLR